MGLFSRDTRVEALRQTPLFGGLSRTELALLAQHCEDMEVDEGTVVCKEGSTGQEFFVIVEGEAAITKNGGEVARLGNGDFFGEVALIAHVRRTATVTATAPLRFFVLTSQAFYRLLDDTPGVDRKVMQALAERLAEVSDEPAL